MDPGEPALVPQWLRTPPPPNNSGGGQQTRGDSAWLRGRGEASLPDTPPGKANPRQDFPGRGGFGPHVEGQRRPGDRPFRGHRHGHRPGSFSARGDPFDDREPPVGPPGADPHPHWARDGRLYLTRSLSEGPQVLGQGAVRQGAQGGQQHRVSNWTEGAEGDPDRRHHAGQAASRRRAEAAPGASDTFEREFPSLCTGEARSGSPVDKAPAWLAQAGGSHGQWTSKLAEVPPGRHTHEGSDCSEPRPLSGSQSARMADAVQQGPPELGQQTVTDKQRLEVKQSRMMIPVVPPQTKVKGAKVTGRGRNERDRDVKLYNSMVSASMKVEDSQKDGTVVLGRRTGVLPKMTISWGEAPAALNGIVQEAQLSDAGYGELNGHHQHSASMGRRDSAMVQERQRQHQRQQSRNSFFDLLKKKSSGGGDLGHPEAVKRVVSAPTGRMKSLVACSMEPSALQVPVEDKKHEEEDGGKVDGSGDGPNHVQCSSADQGDCLVPQDSLETVLVHSPKAEDRFRGQISSFEACPCVPPSAEEERLLREMGWESDQDNDDDFHLTEEEISAFKAQQYKRRQSRSSVLSPIQCTSLRMCQAKLYNSSEFLAGSHGSELTASDSESQEMQ
eukprot:evm.model.scf_81.13 EVM.evm.TU.scf_81.13   scf_81:143960-146141(+)